MLSTFLVIVFIVAYVLIAIEHNININKAAIALVAGVLSWMLIMMNTPVHEDVNDSLSHHLSEISGILFFLMGAMTIVELIDAHEGFSIVTKRLTGVGSFRLIWVLGFITFILSALLDNLTSTILMISLLSKILPEGRLRLLYAGFVVVAANAGGAWSPIGDVTTTMLWIGGQLSTFNMIQNLLVPSLINLLLPLLILNFIIKRERLYAGLDLSGFKVTKKASKDSQFILFMGLGILISVPVFKIVFHLPPYMGMLFGLGIMWCITEILNGRREAVDKKNYTVAYALRNIDTSSILFFLGILLSISALELSGVLEAMSKRIDLAITNKNTVLLLTGFLSAIIDNVPLVAAYQGMYSLSEFGIDHSFWQLLAYCSGTGGSMLIIGSAAGVVAMGLEKITFTWYLKNIGWMAALGYAGGFLFYVFTH
ncbi:MAG: sodium:proton antiporter NhaD [Bacteroidia bacterium]|jgi:Na+/H+ antiporter NhaD/arsenite permease-like protein|nr:sodium:proton antiporter NhaD [Bacteroidia bacterium]